MTYHAYDDDHMIERDSLQIDNGNLLSNEFEPTLADEADAKRWNERMQRARLAVLVDAVYFPTTFSGE